MNYLSESDLLSPRCYVNTNYNTVKVVTPIRFQRALFRVGHEMYMKGSRFDAVLLRISRYVA